MGIRAAACSRVVFGSPVDAWGSGVENSPFSLCQVKLQGLPGGHLENLIAPGVCQDVEAGTGLIPGGLKVQEVACLTKWRVVAPF